MSDPGFPGGPAGPSEEELRAAYEAELARVRVDDMIAQATVSLLNLGARRLGLAGPQAAGERDIEQVRDAIDASRALIEILQRSAPQDVGALRDALSQLQMAYAREAQAPPAASAQSAPSPDTQPAASEPAPQPPAAQEQAPGAGQEGAAGADQRRPGPAESSGRLWVPGR